jgi:two-component system cell cycle sensor histidine kinase/response regulator CckA
LADVVSDMTGMLERVVGSTISVTSRLDPKLCLVKGDRGKLDQALLNLVVNARDAMPNGGLLTIEASNCAGAEPHVVLRVSDTGTGMDEATRARIFEPFFTTKDPDKGTGLGLAVVKAIVEEHGGFIRVSSEVGKGTTVNLYFPSIEQPAATAEFR